MTLITGRSDKSTSPHAGEGKRGFTLLELVLVMLILSVFTALAAPFLNRFLAGRKSVNASAQIVALAQYARTQAISTGVVYRLNVDPIGKAYFLTTAKGTDFEALPTEFGRHFSLPESANAAWQLNSGAKHEFVDFYPDGRADAATLQLTDASGTVFEMGCRSETEMFEVIDRGNR